MRTYPRLLTSLLGTGPRRDRTEPTTTSRHLRGLAASVPLVLLTACSIDTAPSPRRDAVTAHAYILPGAADLAANAFGDQPVVVRRGERLRWRNADTVAHDVVADATSLPEFRTTGILEPGQDASFDMNTPGLTRIHCTIHPQMVGTLVVQD